MSALWWPTTSDVAALLTARTLGSSGEELGEFTVDTRPTTGQVMSLIEQSVALVTSVTGGQDLPPGTASDALRSLVALRTAMSVELSYFPEQVGTDTSPFDKLQSMYRDEFENVTRAVDRALGEEASSLGDVPAGSARHTFPASTSSWDY